MATTASPQTQLLLRILDEAYDTKGWQGTVLRGALRGVDPELAAWRPAPRRHSIRDLALHCAYWKYAVRRRLTGERRGAFPLKGSNFFDAPARLDERQWRADLRLLAEQHAALKDAVEAYPADRWHARAPGGKWLASQLVYGVAAHDVYHTGQIQLIKRLRTATEAHP